MIICLDTDRKYEKLILMNIHCLSAFVSRMKQFSRAPRDRNVHLVNKIHLILNELMDMDNDFSIKVLRSILLIISNACKIDILILEFTDIYSKGLNKL